MNFLKILPVLGGVLMAGTAHAAVTQIGTLGLENNYSTLTYFDPATPTLNTKSVSGAPVQITSSFVGYSGSQGGSPDATNDLGLQTTATTTNIRQLNRFFSTNTAGAVQWKFNLTTLDSYLATNNLSASALTLNLSTGSNDFDYDIYLSYTNGAEGITLTDLNTTQAANYTNFYGPGHAAAVGDVVNNDFKVIAKVTSAGAFTYTNSINLLSLYNSGVKEFNLTFVSADFGSGRNIAITDSTSGLFLDTVPVPEPSVALLGGLGMLALLRRRRD